MDERDEEALREIFSSVRPYLAFPSELGDLIEEISGEVTDLEEFEKELEGQVPEQEDPSKAADCKILLNKLRAR